MQLLPSPIRSFSRYSVWILIGLWILGLLSGVSLTETTQAISSLMGSALSADVSIVSLVVVTLLPLLLSAFAVYIKFTWLIFPIIFAKACMVGAVSQAIVLAYGSAGWLVRSLVMFSDSLMLVPLCWFWIRRLSEPCRKMHWDLICSCCFALTFCLLDRIFALPVLMALQ